MNQTSPSLHYLILKELMAKSRLVISAYKHNSQTPLPVVCQTGPKNNVNNYLLIILN